MPKNANLKRKPSRKELDILQGFWTSELGVDVQFPSGITVEEKNQILKVATTKYKAAKEKKKQQQRKKKNLAAKKKRADLKAAGIKVSKTADQTLEDNIVRMLTRDGVRWSPRESVKRIMRAYKLTKK